MGPAAVAAASGDGSGPSTAALPMEPAAGVGVAVLLRIVEERELGEVEIVARVWGGGAIGSAGFFRVERGIEGLPGVELEDARFDLGGHRLRSHQRIGEIWGRIF